MSTKAQRALTIKGFCKHTQWKWQMFWCARCQRYERVFSPLTLRLAIHRALRGQGSAIPGANVKAVSRLLAARMN